MTLICTSWMSFGYSLLHGQVSITGVQCAIQVCNVQYRCAKGKIDTFARRAIHWRAVGMLVGTNPQIC